MIVSKNLFLRTVFLFLICVRLFYVYSSEANKLVRFPVTILFAYVVCSQTLNSAV